MREHEIYSYWFTVLLTALTYLVIVNRKGNPSYKMAWLFLIIILPVFGIFLYLFLEYQRYPDLLNKKQTERRKKLEPFPEQDRSVLENLRAYSPEAANLSNYLYTGMGFPAYQNTEIKYAFAVAKTFYMELLDAGVKIYQFIPGFLHTKAFVSDDKSAVVGTINLDYRSLYLHFEDAVFFCGMEAVGSVEQDFTQTLLQCRKITKQTCKKEKIGTKIYGRVLRLIAPLL